MTKGSRGKWMALAAATLLAASMVAGCGSDDGESGDENGGSGSGTEKVQLLLPAPAGVNFLGFHVAKEKFWPEDGLDVEPVVTDGSSVVAQQLVSGNGTYGVLGAASLYAANVEGGDLVGIATLTHDDVAQLSAPEDSDITEVSQLDGGAVGIPSAGDGSVPIVEAILEDAGLQPKEDVDMPVVGAGGPAVVQALENGRIDAYAHGQSDIPGMEIEGGMKLRSIMPEAYQGLPGNMLGVRAETLEDEETREIAIKLARGWLKAGQFLSTNPEESLEIGCNSVPEQCENMDVAELQGELSAQTQSPLVPDAPGTTPMDKAEVLIKAVVGEITQPLDEVFPDTYIEEIDAKLEEE